MSEREPDAPPWLTAARAGSLEALGEAFQTCRAYLLHVAQQELDSQLRAKGGASDLVQETFLEAQRDFAQFQGRSEAELRAWLRQMLLHNLANFRRHYLATDKRRLDREVALPVEGSSTLGPGPGPAAGPTPSGQVMHREQAEVLQRALERLPEDYRRVLALRYDEHLAFDDIARLLDRSANAVRKLWARAITRLQEEMEGPP